jgi:hypothetical protein
VTELEQAGTSGAGCERWPEPAGALDEVTSALTSAEVPDIVEVWGLGSFPASDPPANW